MSYRIYTWGIRLKNSLARLDTKLFLILFAVILIQGKVRAQPPALVPPQTVAGVEFAMRSASLQMISPGAANGPAPTARFSIAMTNRNKSSIGLLIESAPSGASTDTGLDLKSYNNNIAQGLMACSNPCQNIRDSDWIVLQPNQTDNVVVAFWTRVPEPQRHRKSESVDLTLILLVKEGDGSTTKAVLSWSDVPIRNEIQ
jgi:hypothetical protein